MSGEKKRKKKPFIAILLSILVPGLGQIYTDQNKKGLMILILNFSINLLILLTIEQLESAKAQSTEYILHAYFFAGFVLWAYAVYDAKTAADRINAAEQPDGEA